METAALWFVLAGIVVGFASGLLGIGGAVLLIPILVLGFHFSQGRAQGTSIGALVPPIGIFAAIHYHRSGLLDLRAALFIAAGFAFGALAGAAVVPHVPQLWLKRAFASLLVFIAVQMAFGDPNKKVGAALPGFLAIGALWIVYFVRRALGKKPSPPAPRPPPPPQVDYFI